jgi:hypothetical protein
MRQRRRFYQEECGQEFRGCDDVRNLSVRHFSLPGFAAALAEAGTIEGEGRISAFGESQRIHFGHLLFNGQPGAGDENARLTRVETIGVAKELADEPLSLLRTVGP